MKDKRAYSSPQTEWIELDNSSFLCYSLGNNQDYGFDDDFILI